MLVSLLFFSDHKILHGGITHSFAFAGLVALLVWLLGRGRGVTPVIGITSFLLVASHVVVDWVTGPQWGLHPSHGLIPFWPFSDTRFVMPLSLFKGVEHANLFPGALYTALWEMLLLGPATTILVIATKRQRLGSGPHHPRTGTDTPRLDPAQRSAPASFDKARSTPGAAGCLTGNTRPMNEAYCLDDGEQALSAGRASALSPDGNGSRQSDGDVIDLRRVS